MEQKKTANRTILRNENIFDNPYDVIAMLMHSI